MIAKPWRSRTVILSEETLSEFSAFCGRSPARDAGESQDMGPPDAQGGGSICAQLTVARPDDEYQMAGTGERITKNCLAKRIAEASSLTVAKRKQAFYTQFDLDHPKAYGLP
jgi:hypothetical protein